MRLAMAAVRPMMAIPIMLTPQKAKINFTINDFE
jgi:hypothetical protein